MIRKTVLLLGLVIFAISISGCNTVKGAAAGAQKDWEEAQKADEKMQKVLW